jgi:serine/threonine-protein kinase
VSSETYGSYELLRRLATGGMAQIFLARERGDEDGQLMVVKRILPHLAENEDFVRMFLDEARIAARLNHPNIVQIFNLGALGDSFFIAMEYIHGEDVRRLWKRAEALGHQLPVPLVCRILAEVCAGLDHAHKKTDPSGRPLGIVHRDISPQNLIITFDGGVKIVDFGIAKAADQATVTRSGVLKGKYSYMSPEQASGEKIDARSDVFAAGIVLYELLTGQRLFKRGNDVQTLNAVTECEVTPPSDVDPRITKDLNAIVLKALAKRREDRYQEARHLAEALEKFIAGRKLPGSREDLAQFMRMLYRERLEREDAEGVLLFEEEPKRGDERATRKNLARGVRTTPESIPIPKPKRKAKGPIIQPERPEFPRSHSQETLLELGNTLPTGNTSVTLDPAGGTLPPGATVPSVTGQGVDFTLPPGATEISGATRSPVESRRLGVAIGGAALVLAIAGVVALRGGGGARLQINTEPAGATVILDGKPVPRVTPCTLPGLKAGEHRLLVGKAGHFDHELTVAVPSNGQVELPVIVLKPVVAAAEPAPAPQVPSALAVTSPPSPAVPEVVKDVGKVHLIATPWATVSCGEHQLGRTPIDGKALPVGGYDCVFRHPKRGIATRRVEVRANQTSRVTVRF